MIRFLRNQDATEAADILHSQLGLNAQASIRTNSIVIRGDIELLKLAGTILDTLDADPAPEKNITFLYQLKNAAADQLAATAQQHFDKGILTQADHADGLHITITPNAATNTLLIAAPPRYVESIKKTLTDLDLPATGVPPTHF
jgi:type II secretory pathway component GspD/PulD (secretin)